MVKFEFTLSDVDAENLFNCIGEEIQKCRSDILEFKLKGNELQGVIYGD